MCLYVYATAYWDIRLYLQALQLGLHSSCKTINLVVKLSKHFFQDKEEAFFKFQEAHSPSPDKILTRMKQAKLEETLFKPLPLSTHYDSLKKRGGWEKL